MALQIEVENLDGIDDSLQSLYVKGEDDKYRLDIEGMPDVSGLKNALKDERDQRKSLSKKVKDFDSVDMDFYKKVHGKRELFQKFEESGGVDEDAISAQVETRTGRMKEEYEARVAGIEEKLGKSNNMLAKVLVDNTITDAALKGHVLETALPDVLTRARDVFKMADGKVVPQDNNGDVMYGKDGVHPLTQEEWLAELKITAAHLFKPSKGGGAGPGGEQGGGAAKVHYRSDLKDAGEKAKFIGNNGMDAYLNLPEKRQAN